MLLVPGPRCLQLLPLLLNILLPINQCTQAAKFAKSLKFALWDMEEDGMRKALTIHNSLMRSIIRQCSGYGRQQWKG